MLDRGRRSLARLRPGVPAEAPPSSKRTASPDGPRKPQRATPRNVAGQGPLVAAPGLHLGIVVIVRNEAPYLEEWLAYHVALGVDHVFLYDNGSDDELQQVVERHVNHGLLTIVHWPLPGGQLDAYSHALRFFGPSVDWLAFIDVDEFIVPLVDDDIPAFLARFSDAADIRIPRVDFGFSGHRSPPEGLTIDAYTGVADVFGRDPSRPPRVKTIVQSRGVSAVGIHTATLADVPIARDERPVPTRSVRTGARELAQLNHYYTRSFDEFEAKRFRGSATGRLPRPAIPFDLPVLREDASARRFVARTEATMVRLRSLAPRPYRYGSELRLTQFPRSNDLGLFTEFAVANTFGGATELLREPLMRLENRYEGIGFVGDLDGASAPVTPGWLSGSIHLPPLVEHVRGRLDAHLAPATLPRPVAGVDPIAFDLTPGDERRAYALGFVIATDAPAELDLRLEHADGEPSPPVVIAFDAAGTFGGLVELDARPLHADRAAARVRSERDATLLDLFLVSYG
jgi:Glycosyltransferase family 92